jgi:hypothetical protein
MAASQYLIRLEEDLKEWCGLPELLVFPLKDIDLSVLTLLPFEQD